MKTQWTVNISKIDLALDFDTAILPDVSNEYVFQYGWNKCLNDAHASVTRDKFIEGEEGDKLYRAAVLTKVQGREEQIRSGKVPTTRVSADPVVAAIRKAGADLVKAGMTEAEFAAVLAKMVADRAAAQAPVEPVVEPTKKGKKAA